MSNPLEAADKPRPIKILVAEDNLVNLRIIGRMNSGHQIYQIDIAKDGEEAVEKVKNNVYDVILWIIKCLKKAA